MKTAEQWSRLHGELTLDSEGVAIQRQFITAVQDDATITLRTQLKSVEAERDEAKRLLSEVPKDWFIEKRWFDRRDAFLNHKPKDVK